MHLGPAAKGKYIKVLFHKTLVWNYILISSSNILMENIANVGIHNSKMQPSPSQFYLCQVVVKSINVNTFDSLLFSVVELCMFVPVTRLACNYREALPLCLPSSFCHVRGAFCHVRGRWDTLLDVHFRLLLVCRSDYEWRLPRSRWLCHK